MPTRRSRGTRAAVISALLLHAVLLLLLLPATTAAAEDECALSVSPTSGRAGTTFTFSGSGYQPTGLTLSRDGGPGSTIALSITEDPFQIMIPTKAGDEGTWTATAVVDATECAGEATFTVTLPPTDALDVAVSGSPPADPAAPIVIASMGLAVLVAAGYSLCVIARRGSGI